MKTVNYFRKSFGFTLLFIAAFGTNSCKKPLDNVDLIISTKISEATVSIQFIDAATGEQVGFDNTSKKVIVEIEGEDQAMITDNAGSSTIKTNNGFLTLAVKKGIIPSESNTINFHLVASANDYVTTTLPITIRDKGTQHFVVYMVDINNPPNGVGAIVNTALTTDANGATLSDLTITTPSVNTSFENTSATLNIPAGTVLLDEDFVPVTGTITTTFVYFNNQDEGSLKSFPGGFNATTATSNDLVFKTGGYVSLVLKNGGGKEVKNFGSAVQMSVEIPPTSTDNNGVLLQSGMTLPIWSYQTSTGIWTNESQPLININGTSGKLEVNFSLTHLSYWNLHMKNANTCPLGGSFTVTSSITAPTNYIGAWYYADGTLFRKTYFNAVNQSVIPILNAPSAQPLKFKVFKNNCDYQSGNVLTSMTMADLCSGNYLVNLPAQNLNPSVNVTVNATCDNKPGRIYRPTITIYAKEIGSTCGNNNWQYVGEMVDGHLLTNTFTQGKTYQIGSMFGNKWQISDETYTVLETDYIFNQVLPVNICNLID